MHYSPPRYERLAGHGRQSILRWYSTLYMQYSVCTVLSVCCTRCSLMIMGWRDWAGWFNFVCWGDNRVEDEKERQGEEMGYYNEILGLRKIGCARQSSFPDMAGTTPAPAGNYTDIWSFTRNQVCRTPDFSSPLVSSISFPSSTLISFLSSTLPSCLSTKLSHSSLSLDVTIMTEHWVWHTPSIACRKYSNYSGLAVSPSFSWLRINPWL